MTCHNPKALSSLFTTEVWWALVTGTGPRKSSFSGGQGVPGLEGSGISHSGVPSSQEYLQRNSQPTVCQNQIFRSALSICIALLVEVKVFNLCSPQASPELSSRVWRNSGMHALLCPRWLCRQISWHVNLLNLLCRKFVGLTRKD